MGAAGGGGDDGVHLVDHLAQLEVRVLRRDLELEHQPVELVDEEHHGQSLRHRRPDRPLSVEHHALHSVDDDERAVGEAEAGDHLVREVDVARRVDQVEEVVLLRRALQQQRHRRRLDRQPPLLLVDPSVGVPPVVVELALELARLRLGVHHRALLVEDVRLGDEAVEQRRLAVAEVADHRHVPHQRRVAHHVEEEGVGVPRRRPLLLDDVERLRLERRDDRLGERLRVLLLDRRLHLLAVHLHGGGIVLLVLVQHDARLLVAVATPIGVLQQSIPSYASVVFHPLLLLRRLIVTVLDLRRISVFVAVNLRPDVVSKLIVEVLLNIHAPYSPRARGPRGSVARADVDASDEGLGGGGC